MNILFRANIPAAHLRTLHPRKTLSRNLLAVLLLSLATSAAAQPPVPSGLPPALREVDFRPPLGASLSLDLPVHDEFGNKVVLGEYFTGAPVILALVYYSCPTLCDEVLNGVASSLRISSLSPGRDYQVVAFSFDPGDAAAIAQTKKQDLMKRYPKAGFASGWHFLTGDESSITSLTRAVNFHYSFDAETRTFAHASGILVLTPQGKISRFFSGIEFPTRDVQFALMDASQGKIGSFVDHLLLFCYQYDPRTGKYGAAITRLLRWGGILFIAALLTLVLTFHFQERRRFRNDASPIRN